MKTSIIAIAALVAFALLAASSHMAAVGSNAGTIVVVADTGNGASFQLYAINPSNPTKFTQLTHLAANPNFVGWFPQFSPDSEHIAFVYQGPNDPGPNAYIMNADGSNLRQLTNDYSSQSAAWTADGTHILLGTSNTKTGLVAVSVIAADGSAGQSFLTDDLFNNFNAFASANGTSIVYESGDGGLVSGTWRVGADGTNRHRLTSAAQEMCPAAISPDSKTVLLANYCNTDLNEKLFSISIDGTNLHQLTTGDASIGDVPGTYSPDGTSIAFVSNRANPNSLDLFVMNKDGSNLHELTSCPGGCIFPTWGRSH